MKLYLYLFFSLISLVVSAQVGIGTNTPDNSAILEVQATDRGVLFPRMTTVQRTSISNPAAGLHVFDISSNSLWFYNGSFWVNYATQAKYGDVKSGIHTQDHEGWVLLDGRAINTLTSSQQAVVSALGWVGNIPNASNAYLVQNGGALGSVAGSNTVTLSQANLPNVTLSGTTSNVADHQHTGTTDVGGNHSHTGTTATNGNHAHSINDPGHNHNWNRGLEGDDSGSGGSHAEFTNIGGGINWVIAYNTTGITINSGGNHNHTFTSDASGNHDHTFTTAPSGSHNHNFTTSSINGNTAQQAVNIAPQSLTVNMFIYIGQ